MLNLLLPRKLPVNFETLPWASSTILSTSKISIQILIGILLSGLEISSIFALIIAMNAILGHIEGKDKLSTPVLSVAVLSLSFLAIFRVIFKSCTEIFCQVCDAKRVMSIVKNVLSLSFTSKYSTDPSSPTLEKLLDDVQLLTTFSYHAVMLISHPIQMVVSIVLLYQEMGVAVLVMIGCMILVFGPGLIWLVKSSSLTTDSYHSHLKQRLKVAKFVAPLSRSIKYTTKGYDQGYPFLDVLFTQEELLLKSVLQWTCVARVLYFSGFVVVILSLMLFVYAQLDNVLSASTAFTSLALCIIFADSAISFPSLCERFTRSLGVYYEIMGLHNIGIMADNSTGAVSNNQPETVIPSTPVESASHAIIQSNGTKPRDLCDDTPAPSTRVSAAPMDVQSAVFSAADKEVADTTPSGDAPSTKKEYLMAFKGSLRFYVTAGCKLLFCSGLAVGFAGVACEVAAVFWLALWSDDSFDAKESNDALSLTEHMSYLGIIAVFGLIAIVSSTSASAMVSKHYLIYVETLHNHYLRMTSVNQLVNVFSYTDVTSHEIILPQSIQTVSMKVVVSLSAGFAVAVASKGIVLVIYIPFLVFALVMGVVNRQGILQIRTLFNNVNREMVVWGQLQQDMSSDLLSSWITAKLFSQFAGSDISFILHLCGAVIACIVCTLAISIDNLLSAGNVAIVLIGSFWLWTSPHHFIRDLAAMAIGLLSLSRVLAGEDSLRHEQSMDVAPSQHPQEYTNGVNSFQWPNEYSLHATELKLPSSAQLSSNATGDDVVSISEDTLNFAVGKGQHFRIAGRVSMESFVSAIFGETKVPGLLIGDIVASHIPLQMRSGHISVLWTSPLIFPTTLRLNLDPSSRFTDDELWQVLHSVGLGDWAMGLNKRLGAVLYHQTMTEECKQLVDIARVLLARPKILIYEDNSNSSLSDKESSVSIYHFFICGNMRYFADCAVVGIAENTDAPIAILRL